MDIKHFKFQLNDEISTLEIFFSGELKGIDDFKTDTFTKLVRKIKSDAESKLVYLNLNDIQFWDTEGMRQTLILAHDINSKVGNDLRVAIVAPRDGYLYKRAIEKYKDIVDKTVKWKITSTSDLI